MGTGRGPAKTTPLTACLTGEQRCRRMQLQVAGRHERASLQAKALAAWRQWLARKRQRCKLGKRWQQPCQVWGQDSVVELACGFSSKLMGTIACFMAQCL